MKDLKKFIAKKIQYDCTGGSPCPHCGKDTSSRLYWIDHPWTLGHEVAKKMRIKGRMAELLAKEFENEINDCRITGNKNKDAETIMQWLHIATQEGGGGDEEKR